MSIRPTELKDSMYESVDSDMTESEVKKEQVKGNYKFLVLFVVIDFIITICILLHECNFFNDKENNYIFFLINAISVTVFFLFILFSLVLFKICLSKVIKYIYLGFVAAYFVYLLVIKIIYFVNHFDDIDTLDLVFLFLLLVTVVPRLFFFCYMDSFIRNLVEKYDCQKGEEHENFKQNLEYKMRGDNNNTNWSKTSLPVDPQRSSN